MRCVVRQCRSLAPIALRPAVSRGLLGRGPPLAALPPQSAAGLAWPFAGLHPPAVAPMALRPIVSGGLPAVCGRAGIVRLFKLCTLAPIALCPAVSHGLPKPPPAHLLAGRPHKRRGSSFLLAFADKIHILSAPGRAAVPPKPAFWARLAPKRRFLPQMAAEKQARKNFSPPGLFCDAKMLQKNRGLAIIGVVQGVLCTTVWNKIWILSPAAGVLRAAA